NPAHDFGLLRRRGVAGDNPAGRFQDGGVVGVRWCRPGARVARAMVRNCAPENPYAETERTWPVVMDSGPAPSGAPRNDDGGYVNTPTIAPIRHVVIVPDTIDFSPSALISSRRSGAMVPRPPIMMPRLAKLAKPHIA